MGDTVQEETSWMSLKLFSNAGLRGGLRDRRWSRLNKQLAEGFEALKELGLIDGWRIKPEWGRDGKHKVYSFWRTPAEKQEKAPDADEQPSAG